MYKALITDLDGTAVAMASKGDDVSSINQDAVKRAHDAGKIVVCATGRGWFFAKPVIQALGITGPCVIEGGTRVIDPATEETLWEKHMTHASASHALEAFKTHYPSAQFISSVDNDASRTLPPVTQISDVADGTRYMYLLGVPFEQAKTIANQINTHHEAVAHLTGSWIGENLHDIHVTHRLATKEHAILEWHKITGITKSETIGMGDGGNDLPIFQSVGLKVAVSNANAELLELADYIAPTPQEGGLAHIIDTFLLKEDNKTA